VAQSKIICRLKKKYKKKPINTKPMNVKLQIIKWIHMKYERYEDTKKLARIRKLMK